MRKCSRCLLLKEETEFYTRSDTGGLRPDCKICHCKNTDRYRRKSQKSWSYQKKLTKHKITHEQYQAMLVEHNGKCAICDRPNEVIDHNHRTGEVRGLLCNPCNRALGSFLDSPELLRRAAEYVENNGGCRPMVRTPVCETGNDEFESHLPPEVT